MSMLGNLGTVALWPLKAARAALVLRRGGYLRLTLDGEIVDLPQRRFRWFMRKPSPTSVVRVHELAREIADDPKILGLIVEIKSLRAGAAVTTSLREALAPIRRAGKKLFVHLPLGAGTRELVVASVGTSIVGGPQSSIAPLGMALESKYFRKLLDKLGIVPEILARGEFKTAGEALERDSMSEEQRAQLSAVLDTLYEELVSAISEGRNVSREKAIGWIDEGGMRAKDAAFHGLIDGVAYDDEVPRLATGEEKPKTLPAPIYLLARRGRRLGLGGSRRIGVVVVRGPIVSRSPLPIDKLAVDDRIIGALASAREDRSVQGVVLCVESPGGSALASDRIYREVTRLAKKKPVVAYFSNVAASGGYYVAAGAHKIVAQPTTLTGSIGVVAAHLVVAPLLDKLGIVTERLRRGARADMMSTTRRFEPGEREALRREIDGFYRDFVGVVALGRKRPYDEIERLARGRVYSGKDAHAAGLVDILGGFERAVEEVRELIGPEARRFKPSLISPPRIRPTQLELRGPLVEWLTLVEALEGGEVLRDALLLALASSPTERLLAWDPLV